MILEIIPVCPFSRQTLLCCHEAGLSPILQKADNIAKSDIFPILHTESEIITGENAIIYFLNYEYQLTLDYGHSSLGFINYCNRIFYKNITERCLLFKFGKLNIGNLYLWREQLNEYLIQYQDLLQNHDYLLFDEYTIRDLVFASHVSILDYFGYIDWHCFNDLKLWYFRVKSRPSFMLLLQDWSERISPIENYTKLDF